MNTPPRFTEDEIAQMKREMIQIYHDENIALANRVADLEVQLPQWQELGARLVEELKVAYWDDETTDMIIMLREGANWHTFSKDSQREKSRYEVLKSLLELTNAAALNE